jgi:hypothetical protein
MVVFHGIEWQLTVRPCIAGDAPSAKTSGLFFNNFQFSGWWIIVIWIIGLIDYVTVHRKKWCNRIIRSYGTFNQPIIISCSRPRLVHDYDRDYTKKYIEEYQALIKLYRLELYVYWGHIWWHVWLIPWSLGINVRSNGPTSLQIVGLHDAFRRVHFTRDAGRVLKELVYPLVN